MWHMHINVPYFFDFWTNPFAHPILLKSCMSELIYHYHTLPPSTKVLQEMSNWIRPTVKQLWNFAMHALYIFGGLT